MVDQFPQNGDEVFAPARAPFSVTPHDVNPLARVPKSLFIGTGGNVTLRGVDGTADVIYKNLPDAYQLDVRALYVRDTGTTAEDIVAQA